MECGISEEKRCLNRKYIINEVLLFVFRDFRALRTLESQVLVVMTEVDRLHVHPEVLGGGERPVTLFTAEISVVVLRLHVHLKVSLVGEPHFARGAETDGILARMLSLDMAFQP